MGLKYPEDFRRWEKWYKRQNKIRYVKDFLKKNRNLNSQNFLVASKVQANPNILIALGSTSSTQVSAVLIPAEKLENLGKNVAVIAPIETEEFLVSRGYSILQKNVDCDSERYFSNVKEVIATDQFLPVGRWAHDQCQKNNWQLNIVQHGLLHPFANPLPANSYLFCFSEEDASFWKSGRQDVNHQVVGLQLLFDAHQKTGANEGISPVNKMTFLGQMHGIELSRLSFAKSSYDFCRKNDAIYRPHPAEKDKISTLTHKIWVKKGIKIDTSGTPLNQSNTPVVSIFSTGVLEAAIRGVPAWVYHSNPPAWLIEFWERYGMNQWGSEPTPAPVQPDIEPALAIANIIAHRLEK